MFFVFGFMQKTLFQRDVRAKKKQLILSLVSDLYTMGQVADQLSDIELVRQMRALRSTFEDEYENLVIDATADNSSSTKNT